MAIFQRKYKSTSLETKYSTLKGKNVDEQLGLLSFFGQDETGELSNMDASFVSDKIAQAINDPNIKGLVVDFSNLKYEWGNRIVNVLQQLKEASIPCAAVNMPSESKLAFWGTSQFFPDVDKAIYYINEAIVKK